MKSTKSASPDPLSPRQVLGVRTASEAPTLEPAARRPLTDRGLRHLQPGQRPIDVRDGSSGLIVTVLPSGRRQFSIRYRFGGKQRRLMFGEYPAVLLAEARKRARHAFSAIDNGHDPAGEQQAAKARPTDTVAALVKEYAEKHVRVKQRGWKEEERVLNVNVLPFWKDRSVRELTRRDVRALVAPIVDRGSPIMANRVLAVVRRMLNYAIRNDWLDANPASLIDKPGRENSRDRVLADDELRAIWRLLERFPATQEKQAPGRKRANGDKHGNPFCPITPALAAVQKVRLLTAQRGGEVVAMRWQDLDLRTPAWWSIPGELTKNGRPHRVPLTADVAKIIKAQCPDGESRPDSHVFAHFGESVKDRSKKAGAALSRVLGFEFRGHDLRRTAATRMAAAGVPRHHISAVLNHVEGGPAATRVYDRYSYDAEKRAALETWARDLSRILVAEAKPRATVVAMAKRARM